MSYIERVVSVHVVLTQVSTFLLVSSYDVAHVLTFGVSNILLQATFGVVESVTRLHS